MDLALDPTTKFTIMQSGVKVDYISHLDALNPNVGASVMASWSNFTNIKSDKESLLEQLQTTLDVEQLLSIYLTAIAHQYKVSAVELETYHGRFRTGKALPESDVLTLPIRIHDRLMGRLTYFSTKPVSDVLLSSLTGFQKALVYPLRNALAFWQLQQMALKDPLTGIGNRSMYDDAIDRKIMQAERFKSHFALMLLDLDNFKQVNDKHGHLQGDEVLTTFVGIVLECLRGTDEMYRFGGDEFAILLDEEKSEAADVVAARIYTAINQHPLFNKFNVSTSIGCASFVKADTATDLFARADKALYAAKDAGKNCIKIA
jgi:diguanylate cyclase (GGDEF)-like protein